MGRKIIGLIVGLIAMVCIAVFKVGVGVLLRGDKPRSSEQAVVEVRSDDPEMKAAIAMAQAKLPQFLFYADNQPRGMDMFMAKVAFPVIGKPGENEHVWIMPFKREGADFTGRLTDAPVNNIGARQGGQVRFARSQISDWMFRSKGKFYGGWTTCVLLKRMPERERSQALAAVPLQC